MFRQTFSVIALAGLLGLAGCSNNASPSPVVSDADAPATPAQEPAMNSPPMNSPPTTAPPMSDPMPAQQMTCNADAAKPGAIGQAATDAVVEQARNDAGAKMARVLKPGQMVTMEFMDGRLNIDVDDSNVITNVRCG